MPRFVIDHHPLLRFAGEDDTAIEALAQALASEEFPIAGDVPASLLHRPDPYQIDRSLATAPASESEHPPAAGATYAGMTPSQRGAFLVWSQDPLQPAPPAFQRLLIAHLEIGLLETGRTHADIHRDLLRWSLAETWQDSEWLPRALLLALWMDSNGEGIAEWTSNRGLQPELLETAVGLQMLLNADLRSEQTLNLCRAWELPLPGGASDQLALRLRSLTETLGMPPLDHVRDQTPESERTPRPWRTAHRELRLAIPQPRIRPYLQPLLAELVSYAGAPEPASAPPPGHDVQPSEADWQLVLEFGHSRSEFYNIVLDFAQKQSGYLQILDEDKRLVHRITFRKRDLRRFWRIWDYVQNWSSTRVYLNGDELETWKIWPYSQYLR